MKKCLLSLLFCFLGVCSKGQVFSGTDFWFAAPGGMLFNLTGPTPPSIMIYSDTVASGTVTFPHMPQYNVPFAVTACSFQIIPLPPVPFSSGQAAVFNNGFHVTSDNPVAVCYMNGNAASSEMENILPTHLLDTGYVMTFTGDNPAAQYCVVATKNNTSLKIVSRTGQVFNTTISQGQAYNLYSGTNSISGSRISSDKPVALIGYHMLSNKRCGAADAFIVSYLPEKYWGRRYVTVQSFERKFPLDGTSMADILEISAGSSPANIRITYWGGVRLYTLLPYQSLTYLNPRNTLDPDDMGEANTVIESDNPVQVVQYCQGWQCDNSQLGGDGDPEAFYVYPEERWAEGCIISVPNDPTCPVMGVDIIAESSSTADIAFDNAPVGAYFQWKDIGTSSYKYARIPAVTGTHMVKNLGGSKVGIYTYGKGVANSYVYLGGTEIRNSPCNMNIGPVPVNLVYFKALRGGDFTVQLSWAVPNVQAFRSFSVERSHNGRDFLPVADLWAGQEENYKYTDHCTVAGALYYRLRLTDQAGKHSYSAVSSVQGTKYKVGFSLAVNPVRAGDNLRLYYDGTGSAGLGLNLYTLLGQKVWEKKYTAKEGYNEPGHIPYLPSGQYILELIQDNRVEKEKLIIE
jgi:hypothetical protein